MTERKREKFIFPELGSIGGLGSGAFNNDLQVVMDAVERYNLIVPDAVHDAADSLAIAQAVLDGIEAETPEPSEDKAQEIRNRVSYTARHGAEVALARRARVDAATVLVRECMEALPVFEPQFAELFNRLAAEIRPLLAAIENFRSECPNYVMAGYQANRYNQADIGSSNLSGQ